MLLFRVAACIDAGGLTSAVSRGVCASGSTSTCTGRFEGREALSIEPAVTRSSQQVKKLIC